MPFVTFEIEGLVACYRKPESSEEWSFVFPFDEEHHRVWLNYTVNEVFLNPDPQISLADKAVSIAAQNSVPPNPYATDKFYDEVLDITDWHLHNEGLVKKQNNRKVTIKHAKLDSTRVRDSNFAIALKFDAPNRPPSNIELITTPISNLIEGKIEIPVDGQVIIEIDGGPQIPPLTANQRFKINNYCNNCQRDFLNYHKLFKNKRNPRKFCEVLSISTFDLNEGGLVPRTGEPPAFCDGVRIGGDPSGLD